MPVRRPDKGDVADKPPVIPAPKTAPTAARVVKVPVPTRSTAPPRPPFVELERVAANVAHAKAAKDKAAAKKRHDIEDDEENDDRDIDEDLGLASLVGAHAAATKDVGDSGSEWEYEGSDEDDDLALSPTTWRVLTPPERLIKHGKVERGAAYCLPCLAEAAVFNITDVDGGQPTGMLYKIPAGMLCRPCKQDAGSHPRSPNARQPDGRKPRPARR
eukprot:jgi/Tetstr1/465591/TSEL_010238.t1